MINSVVMVWSGSQRDSSIHTHVVLVIKNPRANTDVRDTGLIPGSERSPGVGNDKLLQDPCLQNYMYRETWAPI